MEKLQISPQKFEMPHLPYVPEHAPHSLEQLPDPQAVIEQVDNGIYTGYEAPDSGEVEAQEVSERAIHSLGAVAAGTLVQKLDKNERKLTRLRTLKRVTTLDAASDAGILRRELNEETGEIERVGQESRRPIAPQTFVERRRHNAQARRRRKATRALLQESGARFIWGSDVASENPIDPSTLQGSYPGVVNRRRARQAHRAYNRHLGTLDRMTERSTRVVTGDTAFERALDWKIQRGISKRQRLIRNIEREIYGQDYMEDEPGVTTPERNYPPRPSKQRAVQVAARQREHEARGARTDWGRRYQEQQARNRAGVV